jgi:pimeloyl-ACP methyl ester carboxylesterase
MIGLRAPERCEHLLLESFHFYRNKSGSRRFFQGFANRPHDVSPKLQELLASDHGAEQWQHVVQRNSQVWLRLAAESARPGEDLFGGRLGELAVPVTFMHGRRDPRTEPGEIERAHAAIPGSKLRFIENGRHSPHSEEASTQECSRVLREFILSATRS